MALPVVTVASGGLPVVAITTLGLPVIEATNGRGLAVTIVTGLGLPVIYEGGAPGGLATLDGVAVKTALSNGNLTVTLTTAGGNDAGARTAVTKTTGKFYHEVRVTKSGGVDPVGLLSVTGTYANMITAGTNCFIVFSDSGVVYSNNANAGVNFGAVADGAVVGIAVDLTTRRVWARIGAGLWNTSGTHDPATGAFGVVLAPTVAFGPAIGLAGVNTDNMTANFGATAYANAAPSGFGNWPAA